MYDAEPVASGGFKSIALDSRSSSAMIRANPPDNVLRAWVASRNGKK